MANTSLHKVPQWKWYEDRITDIFRRLKGATVEPDIQEMGQTTQRLRQIDILITVPLSVDLGSGFRFIIPVKIVVECKERKRAIGISVIDEVAGLKDDVRAHLAIVVAPKGVSEGAIQRAKAVGVRPIVITKDLITVVHRFRHSKNGRCLICEYDGGESSPPAEVGWRSEVEGYCDWCNGLHVRCPDCHEVFGIHEVEYGQALRCPGDCGAIFFVEPSRAKDSTAELKVILALDAELITSAYSKSTKRLTPKEVERLINRTRWQHWTVDRATIGVTESGYMDYGDHNNLYLTKEGEEWAKHIAQAEYPTCY